MLKSRTATILAATALVVAVFGSTPIGHAAGELVLARNSVGAAQLKQSAVTGAKIRKNAVTGAKVKNGTLTTADFKPGQLPAGPQGPKGDPGDKGDPGAQGPKGEPGLSGLEEVVGSAQIGAGLNGVAMAVCPAGKHAVGGGFTINLGYLEINESRAVKAGSLSVWRVYARNTGAGVGLINAYAYCAFAS